jgi:RDD family
MDQILARTLDVDPQFKPGIVDGSAGSAVLVKSSPAVLIVNDFVSALSSYGRDSGYRGNDPQLGPSFSNPALASNTRGNRGELWFLHRRRLYGPTIGCDKIMKMILAAGVLGVTLLQGTASELGSQFPERETIGRWQRAAEWLAGRSSPIRISAGRSEKSWEIGGHKHEGNVVTGQNFVLEKGETTSGDLVLVRGHAKIDGTVNGDCVLVGSDADISGTINGDTVSVASKLRFSPGTVVNGDFVSVVSSVFGASEVHVNGERINMDVFSPDTLLGFDKWFSGTILLLRPMSPDSFTSWFGALFVLAFCLGVGVLFPRLLADTGKVLQERAPASLLSGFAIVPAAALFCFLLLVTVLGILVIPFVVATLIVFSLIGNAAVFQAIGQRLAPKLKDQKHGALAWIALGAVVCWIIYCIPVIGFLAGSLVFLAGLGAFSLYVVDRARATPTARLNAPAKSLTADSSGESAAVRPSIVAGSMPDFWRRLGANLIDLVVLYSLLQFTGITRILVPAWVLYRFGMYVWKSATLGEIVLNLRVEKLDGGSLVKDYGTAIVRALASLLSLLSLGLGFVWILFDPQRQTWHDKISGSVVVPVAPRSEPRNLSPPPDQPPAGPSSPNQPPPSSPPSNEPPAV